MMPFRVLAILGPVLALGQTGFAQVPVADDGTFVVRAAGTIVGREEFALRQVQDPRGGNGFTLSAVNTYPSGVQTRTVARFGARRVTVRIASGGNESAQEYPGGRRHLVADDSVFALFAIAISAEPGQVQVFVPRTGERHRGTLSHVGTETTTIGGEPRELRHLVLAIGDRARHLWFDSDGRLLKVTIPHRDLVVERLLP